jgi:hypothetical protein
MRFLLFQLTPHTQIYDIAGWEKEQVSSVTVFKLGIGDWALGIGHWGLGIGDW